MFVRSPSDSEAYHPLVFNLCELWVPHAVMPAGVAKVTRGGWGTLGCGLGSFSLGRPRATLPGVRAAKSLWLQILVPLGLAQPGRVVTRSEACKVQRWLRQNEERVNTAPWAWEHWGPRTHFKLPARMKPRLLGSNSEGVSPSPGEATGKPQGNPVATKSTARGRRKGTSRQDPFRLCGHSPAPHAESTVSCCKVSSSYPWTAGVSMCAHLHRCVGRSR